MRSNTLRGVFRLSLILALGAGVFSFARPAFAATYSITIMDTQFVPATLQASVGDTVTFINNTTATQSARSTTASGFNTGDIGPSKSKSVTLVNEGTFTYTSQYDSALTGIITVASGTGLSTTSTSTSTASITSNPTTSQPQPVSGTTETLMILVSSGFALLGAGAYARWKSGQAIVTLIDVPLVSSKHGTPTSDSTQRE